MKNGTLFASKLKKAYNKHKQSTGIPIIPDIDDPMRRLAIGVLGVDNREEDVERAVDRLLTSMVDWNEVRVSTVAELQIGLEHKTIGHDHSCQHLINALQAVYYHENKLSLDRLKGIGRRDARHYLESLNGVNEYAIASIILWSLSGHAIPVNNRLLQALQDANLVHPSASRAEVQAFLERHISSAQAKEFCINMRSFIATKKPAAKRPKAKTPVNKKKKANSIKHVAQKS